MKVYVTYNYSIKGEVLWGSCIFYNLIIDFPLKETDMRMLAEKVADHEEISHGYLPLINFIYIMPLAE